MKIPIGLAIAACLPTLAAAQLYKWVDDKGVTHYSETPPPSGKSQTVPIKPRTAPAPEPAKAVPAGPKKAGASPAQPRLAPPAETPGEADLRRLSGEWKTAEGQSPRFIMTIQPFGSSVMMGFQRVDGGKTQVSGGNNYDFEGGGGQGRFSVDFPPTSEWDVRMKPTRVDYRLRADALEATITSSVFAGSYTLRR